MMLACLRSHAFQLVSHMIVTKIIYWDILGSHCTLSELELKCLIYI